MEGISSCWIMWNCMYLWFVQYWYRYVKKSLRFIISYHFYLLLQISHASTWMISYQCVSYDQGPFLIVITTSNMVCSKHARKSYIFVHFNYLPMSLIIRRVSIFILLSFIAHTWCLHEIRYHFYPISTCTCDFNQVLVFLIWLWTTQCLHLTSRFDTTING